MSDDAPKDPLAVLEELLAKQKSGGGGVATDAGTPPAGPDPAVVAAQELAQKRAEIAQMEAAAQARDAALLAQHTQKMQEISASPQYQARVEQNQAAKAEKQHSAQEMEGFEIRQLSTTIVPVSDTPQP